MMINDKFSKTYGYYDKASFDCASYPRMTCYRNELWKNPASRIIYRSGGITLQQVQSAY